MRNSICQLGMRESLWIEKHLKDQSCGSRGSRKLTVSGVGQESLEDADGPHLHPQGHWRPSEVLFHVCEGNL